MGDGSVADAPRQTGEDPDLSVVLVTYNEVERIGRCIESVFRACAEVPSFEVVLVDSNSTDGTVDVARDYPVTILQLPTDTRSTPGAGRYVGGQAASGDSVLFVDGDMWLTEGWVEDARRTVQNDPGLAGVDGYLNECPTSEPEEPSMLRGVALYDADALEAVSGFDPHLTALEDIDLGLRLTEAGYRLRRLPTVVASHPTVDSDTGEAIRRWHHGYYFGVGQVLRKGFASPRRLPAILSRYRYPFAYQLWLAVGVVTAVVGLVTLLAWSVCSILLVAADAAMEGPDRAARRVLEYALLTVGLVWGLVMGTAEHEAFPAAEAATIQSPEHSTFTAAPLARSGEVGDGP